MSNSKIHITLKTPIKQQQPASSSAAAAPDSPLSVASRTRSNIDDEPEHQQQQQPQHRYMVKFAHIPSEAFWCSATTWRELSIKAQQVWGLERPYFTFTTTNALDRVVTVRVTCAADFESCWSNPDAPVMQQHKKQHENDKTATKLEEEQAQARHTPLLTGSIRLQSSSSSQQNGPGCNGPFFGMKLMAHDHRYFKQVVHSSDYYQYSIRPHVSPGLLAFWPARYCLRHTATDEVMMVVDERESGSWGYAVQKAQTEWAVLRPLFKYIDDSDGERTVISIVTAEDFILWYKRRRLLWPELLVFEHAAPALLQQRDREEVVAEAVPDSTTAGRIVPSSASSAPSSSSVRGDGDPTLMTSQLRRSQLDQRGAVTPAHRVGSAASMSSRPTSRGIAPIEADLPRDASYFPSATPGFLIEAKTSSSSTGGASGRGGAAEAERLLASFRPESLREVSDRERVEEERRYQQVRQRHLRELEKALTAPTPGSPSPARRAFL